MTYPTEFYNQNKTIGSNNILHPIYYFQVNLDLNSNELIGPSTNQRSVNVLHPDLHQSSPDLGRAQRVIRKLQNISWFSAEHASGNIEVSDDGTLIVYGRHGTYLNKYLTTGENPLLTLLNTPSLTSTDLPVSSKTGIWANGAAVVQVNNKFAF